jgi:phage protein
MANHAILSASASYRWLNCPPSVRLTERIPDNGSIYAAEGSEAHALCEYKLRKLLGMEVQNPLDTPVGLQYYDNTMEDAATGYAAFVLELLEEIRKSCPDPIVMVEQRLDFSRWVKDGFGTGDAVIVADGTLHVIDFKYGTGVPVSAEGNSQMRLYALGAVDMFGELYDIDTVVMTIYQPRLTSISTDTISKTDLLDWAENTLRPLADLAYKGEGDLNAGSWCRFCKLRSTCRKRAEANLAMAQHDFKLPPTLSDEEIAVILDKLDDLISWAGDVKEYALNATLHGKHFEGWKLVEGRSNRRYTDEAAVAQIVSDTGRDPYEHKLLGITAMEKLLGKKQFATLLSNLVERPQGKPVLVPASDKRPEMTNAKNDFAYEG